MSYMDVVIFIGGGKDHRGGKAEKEIAQAGDHFITTSIGEGSHRDMVIGITFMEPTLVEAREDLKMRKKKKQKPCKQKKR